MNPMFVAMIFGMIIGIADISLPKWFSSVVTTGGNCMSPIAMLLTGITVSNINFKKTFTDVRTYIVAIVRLMVFPVVFLLVAKYISMSETVYICALCSLAMPLGLNTIVVPSAYGKDTSVAAALREYLKVRIGDSEYLFTTRQSEKISRQQVNRIFNKYSKDITPHVLRHFYCTNALEKGYSYHEVANQAGHSNINTTLRYTNPTAQKMRDKANKL